MKPNTEIAYKCGELGVYVEYMTGIAKQQMTDTELDLFEQFARNAQRAIESIVETIAAVQEEV